MISHWFLVAYEGIGGQNWYLEADSFGTKRGNEVGSYGTERETVMVLLQCKGDSFGTSEKW